MGDPLTISAGIGAGVSVLGGVVKGLGEQGNIAAQRRAAQENQQLALEQAGAAIQRGQVQAGQVQLRTGQTIGAQRAAFGASGVDANSGSAALTQATQAGVGAQDAAMVEHNAMSEAWAHRAQASQYGVQAGALGSESGLAEAGTVLGSVGGAAAAVGQTFRARQDWLGSGMYAPSQEQ